MVETLLSSAESNSCVPPNTLVRKRKKGGYTALRLHTSVLGFFSCCNKALDNKLKLHFVILCQSVYGILNSYYLVGQGPAAQLVPRFRVTCESPLPAYSEVCN